MNIKLRAPRAFFFLHTANGPIYGYTSRCPGVEIQTENSTCWLHSLANAVALCVNRSDLQRLYNMWYEASYIYA